MRPTRVAAAKMAPGAGRAGLGRWAGSPLGPSLSASVPSALR